MPIGAHADEVEPCRHYTDPYQALQALLGDGGVAGEGYSPIYLKGPKLGLVSSKVLKSVAKNYKSTADKTATLNAVKELCDKVDGQNAVKAYLLVAKLMTGKNPYLSYLKQYVKISDILIKSYEDSEKATFNSGMGNIDVNTISIQLGVATQKFFLDKSFYGVGLRSKLVSAKLHQFPGKNADKLNSSASIIVEDCLWKRSPVNCAETPTASLLMVVNGALPEYFTEGSFDWSNDVFLMEFNWSNGQRSIIPLSTDNIYQVANLTLEFKFVVDKYGDYVLKTK